MTKHALALCGLALLAAPTLADGFDASVVPAGAGRLIHLDVSGLQRSGLWKHLEKSGLTEAFDDLEEVKEEFGIHPLEDIRSITLYDTGKELEHQTAVLVMNAKVDGALDRLTQVEGYRAVVAGGLTVHSWDDGGETKYAYVHERGHDQRAVLLSDSSDRLLEGLRVMLGDAPSMASGRSKIMARPQPNTFLFAAMSGGFGDIGLHNKTSVLLGNAESALVELGADDENLFISAALVTETVDEATHLIELMRGARALARLVGGDEVPAELLDLLDAVHFNQRENEVRVDIVIEFDLIEELAEEF